jgi:hypothetical protein
MSIGDIITVSGCFTREKCIAGRPLHEIESILGFQPRRFAAGITVAVLMQLPALDQFDLGAYSNVAVHRHRVPEGLDIGVLKANARESWALYGFERLVKVLPAQRHNPNLDPDTQYPPGEGVPQWISRVSLRAKVVAVVTDYPNGRYRASDAAAAR